MSEHAAPRALPRAGTREHDPEAPVSAVTPVTTSLSLSTLSQITGADVPAYARTDLSAGIVHLGVGNFHRAHQIVYLDRLFNRGLDRDFAVIGAGVKPYDAAMRERLKRQDWLSTVVELDPGGLTARVTGAMIDFAEVEPDAIVAVLERPEIRIVSLTITEGGYYVDATTGGFDAGHADMAADAAHPDAPASSFGLLLKALRRRRAAGIAPFTVMSCDNLPENGHVARNTMLGLARMSDPDFADWVAENVAFPSSMVDCITPATSEREKTLLRERFGIEDAAPVACEPFRQWVMEDTFPAGRPRLEEVGVQFVKDVAPYELMKLRILNGGHAAIAYPSALLGYHFVHDAMADPLIAGFLRKLAHAEVIPTVPPIAGVDFAAYFELIASRFSNPEVGDTIPRLCLDGSNRQPKFILPTVQARLEANADLAGLALEVALWCRYCAGTAEDGSAIGIVDERAAELTRRALAARQTPQAFLDFTPVFGDLGRRQPFADAFARVLGALWADGVRAVLTRYIESGAAGR
ncbi:mannitol dehydrogenase family protein [Stappia indica]|uniref:Mannitol dehydrogenase family protein n=1 Tax=Stappia indica TaxID=538381 RepID=A0A857CDJ7_9HYPH|nr:mannitol dehydrogenase family protein [Stappia indica]